MYCYRTAYLHLCLRRAEHFLVYRSSKMPKDSKASDNVPVLATAPSCDELSGVSDLKWSYSEHGHGKAVITGVLCIKYSC
jgi:hypothetical protein